MHILKRCFFSSLFLLTQQLYALDKVTVALDWSPNTNHIGLYVAKHNNFFAQENIEVSFIQPNLNTISQLVASQRVEFGIGYTSDLIHARLAKFPLISIAAIAQKDTSCFAWRKSSGVQSFKDLLAQGKRYGGWGSPEEEEMLKYFAKKYGISTKNINIVHTGSANFIEATPKNADFMWVFMAWGGLGAKLKGVAIETFCPGETEPIFDHPTPLLLTGEKMTKEKGPLLRRFLKAVAQGYKFSAQYPEKAAHILSVEVPELDRTLVKESALFLAPIFIEKAPFWGYQDIKKIDDFVSWMQQTNIIQQKPQAQSFLNNSFLDTAK